MQENPLVLLDAVLSLFDKHYLPIQVKDAYQLISEDYPDLKDERIYEVILKLELDGYLRKYEGNIHNAYWCTFNGSVHVKNGGYVSEFDRAYSESKRVETLEMNQMANANRMTYLTIVLTVFAFLSVFLQCLEKFDSVFRIHIWTAFFVLMAGIVLGAIAVLLLQASRNKQS